MQALLHEQSRSGGADLPGVAAKSIHGGRYGGVDIGVGEDDVRRFTAEFERHFLDVASGGAKDFLADGGGAGEGNLIDAGMVCHRGARGGAEAGHDIYYARRKVGLLGQFGKSESGKRRLFGWL